MIARRRFQIGADPGIFLRIHSRFLLLLPFFAYAFGQNFVGIAQLAGVPADQLTGPPWLRGPLVALALFASGLAHELGHSLCSLSDGGKTRSITPLMLGGVSELSKSPRYPAEEAWMALDGPATSALTG
jgi:Zn-dependent protease